MEGFKIFVVLGVVLYALISIINGAAIDLEDETLGRSKEEKFFKKLKQNEQYALMAMAIANYNYTDGATQNVTSLFPTNPLTKPLADEIPRTLFAAMMNGEVPKNFMKKFNKWIKKQYRLTNRSFDRFATTADDDRLCRDEEGLDCIHIDDAGSQCCPFG